MNCEHLSVTEFSETLKQLNTVDNLLMVSEAVQLVIPYTSGHFVNTSIWTGPVEST